LRNLITSLLFGSLPLSTIVGIALYKVFRARFDIYAGIIVLAMFVINVSIMMTFLLVHLRSNIRRAKRVEILKLAKQMSELPEPSVNPSSAPEVAFVARQAAREELRRISETPDLPIKGQSIALSFVLTAAPLIAAVLDLLASIKKNG